MVGDHSFTCATSFVILLYDYITLQTDRVFDELLYLDVWYKKYFIIHVYLRRKF